MGWSGGVLSAYLNEVAKLGRLSYPRSDAICRIVAALVIHFAAEDS